MKKTVNLLLLIVSIASFISCSESAPKEMSPISFTLNAEDSILPNNATIINYGACISDSTKKGNKLCKIDSITQFGLGISYPLPDSLIGKQLKIKVSGKSSATIEKSANIVLTLVSSTTNESLFYETLDLSEQTKSLSFQWTTFNKEFLIGDDKNLENNARLVLYPFKATGKGTLLTDDIVLNIVAIESEDE